MPKNDAAHLKKHERKYGKAHAARMKRHMDRGDSLDLAHKKVMAGNKKHKTGGNK